MQRFALDYSLSFNDHSGLMGDYKSKSTTHPVFSFLSRDHFVSIVLEFNTNKESLRENGVLKFEAAAAKVRSTEPTNCAHHPKSSSKISIQPNLFCIKKNFSAYEIRHKMI